MIEWLTTPLDLPLWQLLVALVIARLTASGVRAIVRERRELERRRRQDAEDAIHIARGGKL